MKQSKINNELGKNRLGFKVGDVIKVTCRYGISFITIDEIKISNGVTYYYDNVKNRFVNEPIDGNDAKLELAENDEVYKRWKLYLELKNEFEYDTF